MWHALSRRRAWASPVIAQRFHRNAITNREGGVDTEEFRVEATLDRANTVATAWLGLTAGCSNQFGKLRGVSRLDRVVEIAVNEQCRTFIAGHEIDRLA
mgnify:CR=1 FL=1